MFAGFLLGILSGLFAPKRLKLPVMTFWSLGLCVAGLVSNFGGV